MNGNTIKTCLVCCIWLGERRCSTKAYDHDRLSYLKAQIQTLQSFEHNLSKIVFVFNLEDEHEELYKEAVKLIPLHIGTAEVDFIERKNIGLSYGAWSDTFGVYKSNYDYYIFTEDDYFFNDNNFDSYLVNKFESLHKTGYLCMLTINPSAEYPTEPVHAGNSIGISSFQVLNEVWEKFGQLPHSNIITPDINDMYSQAEQKGQIGQTHEIYKLGYNIWDVRDDYSTPHDMGPSRKHEIPKYDHFVEIYFYQNSHSLIIPAVIKFSEDFYFINIVDPQYDYKRYDQIRNFEWGPMNEDGVKNLLIKELFVERIYHKHFEIQENDIVVDVGASVGPFSYLVNLSKPSQIYTFEPSKVEFPFLVKNTKGFPICHINKAVWSGDGVTNAFDVYYSKDPIETIRFKTFRELYAIDRINFLKTDCEGGEYHIFNDENIDFILNNVDVIVGEWHLETDERKFLFKKFRDTYLPLFKNFYVYSVDHVDIKWDLYNDHFTEYYKQVIIHIDNRK